MSAHGRRRDAVAVRAPGSVGNVGPGLDVLGLAVGGLGDTVTVRRIPGEALVLEQPGHVDLPSDPGRHSSALAASAVLRRAGVTGVGVSVALAKELPLAGGQGGSAASAVAAAVATNLLLGAPLDRAGLLAAALDAESVVAGRHLDNIAPSLLGGLCVVRCMEPPDAVSLPVPDRLRVVLAHPAQRLRTAESRAALAASVPRDLMVHQMAHSAALVAACALGDIALLGRALDDRVSEPARGALMPGFREAKAAALAAGALGCSVSGGGPTAFALCDGDAAAFAVADAMTTAYRAAGIVATARVAKVDGDGAREVPLA